MTTPRRGLAIILLVAPLLATGQAHQMAADLSSEAHSCIDLGGMSCERELEDFLRSAEVVRIEDIGEGITKPRRVTLRKNGHQCRAIFKTVNISSTDLHYTNRLETLFTDKYAYEVAAYRIDRMLGIGLVPVTVIRSIDGEIGSLQHWIEDSMKMQEVVDRNMEVANVELLLQRLMLMYVLDAMIYNIDRNFTNILVRPAEDHFFLIDHSRAFRNHKKLPSLKEDRPIPVPERVARSLRDLDLATLQSELDELLSKRQIRAIDTRRELLLTELGDRGVLQAAG
jgi:hypothetical protein